MTPGLQRHLLDRVLRSFALMKHGQRKAVGRLDPRPQDLFKGVAVALPGTAQHACFMSIKCARTVEGFERRSGYARSMSGAGDARFDLTATKAIALQAARDWGLELGEPFAFSNVSYVAPAGDAVCKVAWGGDTESLHEGDALELWNGDGAVRLLRRSGRALLEERAVPGNDLSALPDEQATAIAVDLASRLWRRAGPPFRPVGPEVQGWLDNADRVGSELAPLARNLLAELVPGAQWLVHGDFHHHNILRRGDEFVAIDPKPYLADREYDVPAFLWSPQGNQLEDRQRTERRIAAFVAAGLDDFRIRAWTVIRGAYLRPEYARRFRELLSR